MRVIVVGGGLAGLTAARALDVRGADVLVLEAQGQAGGRTRGVQIGPRSWVDGGAAYLGQRHTALRSLLGALGLSTTPTSMVGDSVFALDGHSRRCKGRFPPLGATALGEMFELLHQECGSVLPQTPWLSDDAHAKDRLTAAQWATNRLMHSDARLFFPLFLGELMAADPAEVSMLHIGFYLRSGGGLSYLNAFEGGAQEERVANGAHQICDRMAVALGKRVLLSHPVRAIRQSKNAAHVYACGQVFTADAVVLAVPPQLTTTIEFEPKLPMPRATGVTAPGCAVKVHLIFPAPLWRDEGLSGWSLSASGPLLSTVDDSPIDGDAGVLTGFVTGAEARRFSQLPPDVQHDAARRHVRNLFPSLPEPSACHVTDWLKDSYAKGCYAALFGPGDWTRLGPYLTRPHGRVHWAGTETSTEFFGLMEGAVRSGIRVAAEVATRY